MINIILAIICAILPFTRSYGIIPLCIGLLALPVGNAFSSYFYSSGLYSFDFYFMALFGRQIVEGRISGRWIMAGCLCIVLYAAFAISRYVDVNVYYARDFRLLLYAITMASLLSLHLRGITISATVLKSLSILAGASCIVYACMSTAGLFVFIDEFYVRNAFRHFSIGSYYCFGFVAFSSFLPPSEKRGILFLLAISISLIAVILTGSRAMWFTAIMLFLAGSLKSRRGVATSLAVLLIGAPILAVAQDMPAAARLFELSPETVLAHIKSRYGPFFREYANFDPTEIVLGGGFAQTFEIPWFAHREQKDTINNFIDSTYLTLYAKFGIFAIFIIFGYAVTYARLLTPFSRGVSSLLLAALAVLWSVFALPYQMTSVGLALVLFGIGSIRTLNVIGVSSDVDHQYDRRCLTAESVNR